MRILITGGYGFIGSHFIDHVLHLGLKDLTEITVLDNLSIGSSRGHLPPKHPLIRHVAVDLSIRDDLEMVIPGLIRRDGHYDYVVHFAAASHVDRSIESPETFIHSNVLGTFNLLDILRDNSWGKDGNGKRFIHISTDEVFGTLDSSGKFNENSPYNPRSPYSASKAGADHIVKSFKVTYGMPTIVTHCCNNYGPRQHEEKFIPSIIRNAFNGKVIPIYGNGKNVREWIHVKDHCAAVSELLFADELDYDTYCIGTNDEQRNVNLCYLICDIIDEEFSEFKNDKEVKSRDLMLYIQDRRGHDFRYSVDWSRMAKLGWSPSISLMEGLRETVGWYATKTAK